MRRKAVPALLVFLGLMFGAVFCLSLRWRMEHDTPILFYLAYLIDHFHYVPYRDVFDMNTPASYGVYVLIGHWLGYSDLGFRLADMGILIAILATTWLWMRRISSTAAWCSVFVFGLLYLEPGVGDCLQRDYLLILPISLAILISVSRGNRIRKSLATGLLFGVAGAIKPHAVIGLPLVMIYQWLDARDKAAGSDRPAPGPLPFIAAAAIGLAVPGIATYVYLVRVGALASYLDIARHYWPLYGKMGATGGRLGAAGSGATGSLGWLFHLFFIVHQTALLGPNAIWSLPAVAGIVTAASHSSLDNSRKRLVLLVAAMSIAYMIYPIFAGQFWDYHWLPFAYFTIVASGLCLVPQRANRDRSDRLLPALILAMAMLITIRPPGEFLRQVKGLGVHAPKGGRVDMIASYLQPRLKPGDTVQPLDWTGGVVHAMLIVRARPATRFIYDFHFYHSVSDPYIQGLRKQFIAQLAHARPRFVVEVTGPDKPWPTGPDTTKDFPELRRLLNSDYAPVNRGSDFVIYERSPAWRSSNI
jgi:hypothetical protein